MRSRWEDAPPAGGFPPVCGPLPFWPPLGRSRGRPIRLTTANALIDYKGMAQAKPPKRVKFFVGMIAADPDLLDRAAKHVARVFGPTDLLSDTWDFDYTDYYTAEMGPDLKRRFVCLEELMYPDRLVEFKRQANELEARICDECGVDHEHRPVNLDPGYLSSANLVLASTKDYSHRIYLGRGVYAEVTLLYERGSWRTLPWTYPDYATEHYHEFFSLARERYKAQTAADGPDRPALK